MSGQQQKKSGHSGLLTGMVAVGAAALGAGLAYFAAHEEKKVNTKQRLNCY